LLSVEGGCVNWTLSNPLLLRLSVNYDDNMCSKSAIIESIYSGQHRQMVSVIATDNSGENAECNVYIDRPSKISLLTSTKLVYVESSYLNVFLHAFDSDSNLFTAIDEKLVNWTLDNHHLRFVSAKEAHLSLNSSQIIIKGYRNGLSYVRASLGNLVSRINLSVVEPIKFFPSHILNMVPGDSINLTLCSIRGGNSSVCTHKINSSFIYKSSNSSIAALNQYGNLKAKNIGLISITAIDPNCTENIATISVNVSLPSYGIHEDVYIKVNNRPSFKPKLYDERGNIFVVNSKINWTVIGSWKEIGTHNITLKYMSFQMNVLVHVCGKIYVTDKLLILTKGMVYPMIISGGSGYFLLESLNQSIVNIDGKNLLASEYGNTSVKIIDQRIPNLSLKVFVSVQKVYSIEICLPRREFLVGEPVKPLCISKTKSGKDFSLNVSNMFRSSNLNVMNSSLISITNGFSEISCYYDTVQSKSLTVSVSYPLSMNSPDQAAIGALIPMVFSGGPINWPKVGRNVEISCGSRMASIYNHSFSLDFEYKGECLLKMRNIETEANLMPLLFESYFNISVVKIISISYDIVDFYSKYNSHCNTPPNRILENKKDHFSIVPNRLLDIFVFLNSDNNMRTPLVISSSLSIESSIRIEFVGYNRSIGGFHYQIRPITSCDLVFKYGNITSSLQLFSIPTIENISSISMPFTQKINIKKIIIGGSGVFSLEGSDSYYSNRTITLKPKTEGKYEYVLSDICSEQKPIVFTAFFYSMNYLIIRSHPVIFEGSSLLVSVDVYDKYLNHIPPAEFSLNDFHLITSERFDRVSINSWRIYNDKNSSFNIKCILKNQLANSTSITVLPRIQVHKNNIMILPGEYHKVSISGPPGLELINNCSSISIVSNTTIRGLSPGNCTLYSVLKEYQYLEPCLINIHVINPINIMLIPSTKTIIQGGSVLINFLIESDVGFITPPSGIKWNISGNNTMQILNETSILITCHTPGKLYIEASILQGLTGNCELYIEPKLELRSPSHLLLLPNSMYQIILTNNLSYNIEIIQDPSSQCISMVKDTIISLSNEGSGVIILRHNTQVISICIQVFKPSNILIRQDSTVLIQAYLIDIFGRSFSTMNGVLFSIISPSGFERYKFNETGFAKIPSLSAESIEIGVIARFSNDYQLQSSISLKFVHRVEPENPYILKGSSLVLKCSHEDPKWETKSSSIAFVSKSGQLTAIAPGVTSVQCSHLVSTEVTVVELKNILIKQVSLDSYQISLDYNRNLSYNIVIPSDCHYHCKWDSNDCGNTFIESNFSGIYCHVNRVAPKKCPESSKLTAMFICPSIRLSMSNTHHVPYTSTYNFGVGNEETILISSESRKVFIPLTVTESDSRVECSENLYLSFSAEGAVIRASERFNGMGVVRISHIPSGERLRFYVKQVDQVTEMKSLVHERDFLVTHDILLLIIVVLTLGFISFILFYSQKYRL